MSSTTTSSSSSSSSRRTIVITGGLGNLGSKLCRHLLSSNSSSSSSPSSPPSSKTRTYKIILVEHPDFIDRYTQSNPLPHDDKDNVIVLPCDLGNPTDEQSASLREALQGADAVIHFSAVNPYPNASWSDSAQSMDHTFNIFQLAVICKVRRVILASSNHVMGGYKDDPTFGPSSILPHSDPRAGTMPLNTKLLDTSGDGKAYAAAKLAGERLAMTLGNLYADTTTFVVLRIGWCQPGENLPSTLSAAGSPPEFLLDANDDTENDDGNKEEDAVAAVAADNDKKDELWYKRMWLSNRDFLQYFDAAIHLNVPTKEERVGGGSNGDDHNLHHGDVHRNVRRGFVLVNAMSRNSGAKWNLDETEKWLGVVSNDDSLAQK